MYNFLRFQLGWWLCLTFAMLGLGAWSLLTSGLLVVLHCARFTPRRWRELKIIIPCAILGVSLDLLAQAQGWIAFSPDFSAPWPIPLWLLGMWLVFATTFAHSLSWVLNLRPVWLALLSWAAFPLSYLPGEAFGVLKFQDPRASSTLFFGALWALGFPLLALWTRKIVNKKREPQLPTPASS